MRMLLGLVINHLFGLSDQIIHICGPQLLGAEEVGESLLRIGIWKVRSIRMDTQIDAAQVTVGGFAGFCRLLKEFYCFTDILGRSATRQVHPAKIVGAGGITCCVGLVQPVQGLLVIHGTMITVD